MQSLGEFFRVVTRNGLLSSSEAREIVVSVRTAMSVVPASEADLFDAIELFSLHKIQFFDALLLATALSAHCTILFSEDLQHRRNYSGIKVLNPFKLTPAELDQLLA